MRTILFSLLLAGMVAFSRQGPNKDSTGHKQAAASDQRGTKKTPLVVDVLDPDKKANNTKEDERYGETNAIAEYMGWMAWAMLVAVMVQAGLFYWQLRIINKSLLDGKTVAAAAEKAANVGEQTLFLTQRAFVVAGIKSLQRRDTAGNITGWVLNVTWDNKGHTPALKFSGNGGAKPFTRDEDIEQLEAPGMSEEVREATSTIGPGDGIDSRDIFLAVGDYERLQSGDLRVFIGGIAEYRDVFPKTPIRITSSCNQVVVRWDINQIPSPFMFPVVRKYNFTT